MSRREVNTNSHAANRKTNRERRNQAPVNFHCNNPVYNNAEPMNFPYYPRNQSIFPAVSDPSLCYPYMNYQIPIEPLSLPAYNLYQPYFRNHSCNYLNGAPMSCYKPPDSEQEYTSLPCVNNDLDGDENKRRFSDPGLPNECDFIDPTKSGLVQSLVDQVNCLKDNNRKLYRELQDVRSEVSYLKQQIGARFYDKEYEPGMLSDIVREIRDAARVREEALLSRVKHMIEERQMAMNHLHMVAEKARNNDRIGKLEEQMKNLCLNKSMREESPSDANASTDQVLELEQVTLNLRRELQEAIAGKKEADAKIYQLDQMIASLRQKSSNSDLLASSDDIKTTSSIDNCSLTTKSSSPVARVVMSGPVTNL